MLLKVLAMRSALRLTSASPALCCCRSRTRTVYTLSPSRQSTAAAQQSIAKTLTLGAIAGVILVIIVGLILGRSIAGPLLAMANTADKIAGGDLSQRVVAPSRDELGRLADAFNQMAAKV